MRMTEDHCDALFDLLRWRRDVRHFRTDPLPAAKLDILRRAMDLAPSVGNARPWRVLRVQDRKIRGRVQSEFERCNVAAAADYQRSERQEYMRLKLAGLESAPEQFAIFTETEPEEGRGLGRRTLPGTLEQSTAMAIYSLWLAARAENIGVGMVSILDPERVCSIFDVTASWRFTAYLCVGFADFDDDTPLLHKSDWQRNTSAVWEDR